MSDYNENERELKFLGDRLQAPVMHICPPPSLLSAYMEGMLEDSEERSIEKHITECHNCKAIIDGVGEEVRLPLEQCSLDWDSIREKFPAKLPEPHGEEKAPREEARLRIVETAATPEVKGLQKYTRLVKDYLTRAGRGFNMSPALAASIMVGLLITCIIWITASQNVDGPTRGGPEAGAKTITVTATDLKEPGSVQIALTPEDFPLASLPVEPGSEEASYSLTPGIYWIRICGEKSESEWQKVEVSSGAPKNLSIKPESNILAFSPAKETTALIGSEISYTRDGRSFTETISSSVLELGPFARGDELSEITIRKEKSSWRYPGTLSVKGGRQVIRVDFRNDDKE